MNKQMINGIPDNHDHRVTVDLSEIFNVWSNDLEKIHEYIDFMQEWLDEMTEWKSNYTIKPRYPILDIWFERPEDAMMFKLRWV